MMTLIAGLLWGVWQGWWQGCLTQTDESRIQMCVRLYVCVCVRMRACVRKEVYGLRVTPYTGLKLIILPIPPKCLNFAQA